MSPRDRKVDLGERLSKLSSEQDNLTQQKEMLKFQEEKLRFQEEQLRFQEEQLKVEVDHLTVENDQLVFEENVLLTEISRSELERSVLDFFPETCTGLSAGNRAHSLFENSRETAQVLPSPMNKTSPLTGDNVATVGQTPPLVAQKLQACKAPDNMISDQSKDDINHVPSPMFTASDARVPQIGLQICQIMLADRMSNLYTLHGVTLMFHLVWETTTGQLDFTSELSPTLASSYSHRYSTRLGVDSLCRQPAM